MWISLLIRALNAIMVPLGPLVKETSVVFSFFDENPYDTNMLMLNAIENDFLILRKRTGVCSANRD